MEWRSLRLLWLDDQKLEHQELTVPDISFARVSDTAHESSDTWFGHCTALAAGRTESFDLLTIDINFAEDRSDPARVLGVPVEASANCSGLYHGMMAQATRRATDGNGNLLPLAWEMRTKTPSAYEATPHLLAEAIRAYGLLRANLAQPADGESLIECIAREHEEAFGTAMPMDLVASGELVSVLRHDLSGQPPFHGRPSDVIRRLLPRWRLLFHRAVKSGTVKIDQAALQKLIEELSARESLTRDELRTRGVVVVGWQERNNYGVSLASILADIASGEAIRPRSSLSELSSVPLTPGAVPSLRNWLEALHTDSGAAFGGQLARFRPLNAEVHSWLLSDLKGGNASPAPFWDATRWSSRKNFARCLVYMMVHFHGLAGGPWSHLAGEERLKASVLGLEIHSQTFWRPFHDATEFEQMGRDAVVADLEAGLFGHDSRLFSLYPWMRDLFRDLALNHMWVNEPGREAKLASKFPGLAVASAEQPRRSS